MKKRILSILVTVSMLFCSTLFSKASAAAEYGSNDETTVIVELTAAAVLEAVQAQKMGAKEYNTTQEAKNSLDELVDNQEEIIQKIKKIYPNAEEQFSYTHTLNGFSITVRESDIPKIRSISGVEGVYISQENEIPPDDSEAVSLMSVDEKQLLPCCDMIGADYMHENGYSGEGRAIAVIDTEFDVNHEMFSGKITNPKYSKEDIRQLISETNLNVNVTANQVYRSEKIPFAYSYAEKDADVYHHKGWGVHGSHVAGIAAGNNGTDPGGNKIESVAPDAQLILMCVSFGNQEYMSNDAILAAIDDAAKMGVDAINLSLGTKNYYDELEMKTINTAANAGIVISCAAGNDGRGYEFGNILPQNIDYDTAGSPDSAALATSVASANTVKVWNTYNTITVSGDTQLYSLDCETTPYFSEALSDKEYEYVNCGTGTQSEFDEAGDLTGKIALVQRSSVRFIDSSQWALDKGAVGVIYINRQTDNFSKFSFLYPLPVPVCLVKYEDGQTMLDMGQKTITVNKEKTAVLDDNNVLGMSDFSSWGTDYTLNLKPEITAPGGSVYSSIPDDNYDNFNGTSMAAPHITGAAALMYQYIDANYSDKYSDIGKRAFAENLMMSSASIQYLDEDNKIAYSSRLQGAGMLNLKGAATTPVYLVGDTQKSKISLKVIDDTFTISFKANNFTDNAVTYDSVDFLCQTDSVTDDGYIGNTKKLSHSVSLPQSVTVEANSTKDISFDVTLDSEEVLENLQTFINGFWVDGFVILSSNDISVPEISIPYTGFYGDWTKAPTLDQPYYSDNTVLGETFLKSPLDEETAIDDFPMLGHNLFCEYDNDISGEEVYDYDSEDYAGISPNGDSCFDTLYSQVVPLRATKYCNVFIKNSDDEIVYNENIADGACGKLIPFYNALSPMLFTDGDYTAEVKSSLCYEGAKEETVSMKFYVDTVAPKILSHEIRTEGDKTYLDIKANDNKYLMGIEVVGKDSDGNEKSTLKAIKALNDAELSVDVTGWSDIAFAVYDYAMNSTTYKSDNPIYIEENGDITIGKNYFVIPVKISNYTDSDINANLITAVYDKNGKLLETDIEKNVSLLNPEIEYSITVNLKYNSDNIIKVFAWDSIYGMKPLCGNTTIAGPSGDVSTDSEEIEINIIHTNDIHGYYKATDRGQIGYSTLKTLIDEQDADLVLDVGDTFHGQSFATVEEGMSIAELMKEVGYDAMTPGNHDWSYGAERIKELEDAGDFAVLASNVVTEDGNDYFETPYLVKEVTTDDGTNLKIGVIGVIDDAFYYTTPTDNVRELEFKEESAEASETAQTLRNQENCDIVIAITHQSDCEGFVKGISGIDAVIAGHEHKLINESYTDADGKRVPVAETSCYFNEVGCLTLTYDKTSKAVTTSEEKIFTSKDVSDLAENEAVKNKTTEIEAREKAVLDEVIAHSDNSYEYSWEEIRVGQQEIGRIVTSSYLYKTNADVAIENAGGIRAGIPTGDVKYSDLISISPYGNTLLTKEMTGAQILDTMEKSLEIGYLSNEIYELQKQAIENDEDPYRYSWPSNSGSYLQFGGIEAQYDMSKPTGSRVVSAYINNAPIQNDKVYTVAMNNYVADNSEYPSIGQLPIDMEYGTCEEALTCYLTHRN